MELGGDERARAELGNAMGSGECGAGQQGQEVDGAQRGAFARGTAKVQGTR